MGAGPACTGPLRAHLVLGDPRLGLLLQGVQELLQLLPAHMRGAGQLRLRLGLAQIPCITLDLLLGRCRHAALFSLLGALGHVLSLVAEDAVSKIGLL